MLHSQWVTVYELRLRCSVQDCHSVTTPCLTQRLVSTGLRQLGFLVSEKDRFSISIGMQMPKVFLTVQLMGVNHRDSQTLIIFQLFLLFNADWVCAHRRHWCSCVVIDYDSGFMSSCSNAGVNWGNDM